MKPKLLIIELWGLGDLVIATPFLRAATEHYEVTLVAKPYAQQLQERLWPGVRVLPFVAPWTAFKGKYLLWQWPWRDFFRVGWTLLRERFDVGLSARWDPRDHFVLLLTGARRRIGFPRVMSQLYLTDPIPKPDPREHRYAYWRTLGRALDLTLPEREQIQVPPAQRAGAVFVHSGAGQPIRVWPLERYQFIVRRLRQQGRRVLVACDPEQRAWWLRAGETDVVTPTTVNELLSLIDQASVFIGNDSGPGHLAAFCGVPTMTFFGPQLPEWFAPLHPQAEFIEGKACPYRPCSDYCRFPFPHCLWNVSQEEAWSRIDDFVGRHFHYGQREFRLLDRGVEPLDANGTSRAENPG